MHYSKWKNILGRSLCLFILCAFISCEKNDVDESGFMFLKVVNGSPNATDQNFTLAGKELVTTGLSFNEASDYIQTNSGTRLVADFKNVENNSTYASGELWTGSGKYFSVFLAGGNGSERVKMFEDNMSTPSNGNVRIRFIHLSDDLPSDIYVQDSTGKTIVNNISRNLASGYETLSSGRQRFDVYGTAEKKLLGSYTFNALVQGKIYTIYFAGSSDKKTTAEIISHN